MPVGLDGKRLDAVALIEKVEELGARYGIGRGIHLGDTIIGTKGRVAFEAPAAEILISAHRELEKLTLLGTQATVKEPVSQVYGQLIHEGKQLDPACRDIEALLASSQARVTRQGPRAAAARQPVRARRHVAAFADGREPRQVRRGGRRMDAGRCLRFLEDHGFARDVPHPGRRAVTCAPFSSTKSPRSPFAADLGQEIRVSPDIPCEEGVLIAVEVLNNKSRYNTIELTSGRMAEVKKGDVVVGALGHRKALFGYSGHLPTELKPGRHRAAPELGRRHRHLRLDQSVARRAVQLQGARAACSTSRTSGSASACRRASRRSR